MPGPLWTCPNCGGTFANVNQSHHFTGKDAAVRASFDRILSELGPVTVLAREAEHPIVRRVHVFSSRNVLHEFRISEPAEIDAAFIELLHDVYAVGEQRHLEALA